MIDLIMYLLYNEVGKLANSALQEVTRYANVLVKNCSLLDNMIFDWRHIYITLICTWHDEVNSCKVLVIFSSGLCKNQLYCGFLLQFQEQGNEILQNSTSVFSWPLQTFSQVYTNRYVHILTQSFNSNTCIFSKLQFKR